MTRPAGPARPPFRWPPSTRLGYTLAGTYRHGPIHGDARIEWRRDGAHYQVAFDVHIQPFIEQHLFSDGRITADGLSPVHYDETFRRPFGEPRVRTVEFGDDEVVLANGRRVPRLAMTQDGASQFVQFVWMFATHPQWLRQGNIVSLPLALVSSLRRWRYEVVGTETLALPFGPIDAVHLKPLLDGPRNPNEYPVDIWIAPTLQYLPVQVVVHQGDDNFAELSLDGLPLQAAPAAPSAPAASAPQRIPFPQGEPR